MIEVKSSQEVQAFIQMPYSIYEKDLNWVAPLEFERRQFLNPKKNPFFKNGEASLFLACQNGRPVGRISAHIYRPHLDHYQDQTGFFGFFESIEDKGVVKALVGRACEWLQKKGMKKIRGPLNFTMNDEVGILIDGFETRPYFLMNHNPAYYSHLLEGCGLQKAKDLYAWHYEIGGLSEQVLQLAQATRSTPGLILRSLDKKHFDQDVALMIQIFNEAWSQNWGFVPMTDCEVQHMSKNLKPIIDPELAFFAYVEGEPAAMSIALPNINEAIFDLRGKLFPFGWAKLIWRLKKKGLKSARLCLMGIRKPYRGSKLGALSVLMNVEMQRRGTLRGYQAAELSWTLEENEKINKGIEFMGGKKYKTYRIYEKEL